jgi:4-alpha-glucanotransferase
MNPAELYQRGYQPIIDLFRSNMSANNRLKINDVLSLLRQWWVPKASEVNRVANEGAYVYYPFDDLLAILALESQLNQTAIIGGDLARMPAEMVEQLQQMAIEA